MKQEIFSEQYIPSLDVRKLITENNHQFSDWEKAAIIWNSHRPLKDKWEDLQDLADETSDAELRKQIIERLDYDRESYNIFNEVTEDFVYTISSRWLELHGRETSYYGNGETAYQKGCQCCGILGFAVKKHQVISNENTEIIKVRAFYSQILEGDEERRMEEFDTGGVCIAKCEYSADGELMALWSCELPKEQDRKVNSLGKGRFENRYVAFPNPFEKNDRIRIIEPGNRRGQLAWVAETQSDWTEKNDRACSKHGTEDYQDARLVVKYWNESKVEWEHDHINPIFLEKDNKEICNSFEHGRSVIPGHDSGAAVWFQPVLVENKEKIKYEDVKGTGIEISVGMEFFHRFLRPLFLDAFDPDLPENRNRFTYAFSDEGRFLSRFEEECLEHNFFTYQQMESILRKIEEIDEDPKCPGQRLQEEDSTDLLDFAIHMEFIMEDSPETRFISVMS